MYEFISDLLFLWNTSEFKNSIYDQFNSRFIRTMATITAMSIANVCKVSVQTIVFIPPLKVYIQINPIEIPTVTGKGIFQLSNTNCCKTIATKNNLNEAPNILERKK